jgi:uncharacterized membrane protein
MTLDTWLHFLHVLSAVVWVGGGFVLSIVGSRARASKDPNAIPEFSQTLTYIGTRVMLPAVVGTLVFGVWMVLENVDWNFSQLWVRLAIGLFVLAFLIGAIYLGRLGIQLQRLASNDRAAAVAVLGRWLAGYWLVLLVLLIALWDMIFKPGMAS